MIQEGQVFKLKTKVPVGKPLWRTGNGLEPSTSSLP